MMLNGGTLPIIHDELIKKDPKTNQMIAFNEIVKIKSKYSL